VGSRPARPVLGGGVCSSAVPRIHRRAACRPSPRAPPLSPFHNRSLVLTPQRSSAVVSLCQKEFRTTSLWLLPLQQTSPCCHMTGLRLFLVRVSRRSLLNGDLCVASRSLRAWSLWPVLCWDPKCCGGEKNWVGFGVCLQVCGDSTWCCRVGLEMGSCLHPDVSSVFLLGCEK